MASGSSVSPTLQSQIIANSTQPTALVSFISANNTTKAEVKPIQSSAVDSSPKLNTNTAKAVNQDLNAGVEEAVREYFADIPLMIEIAKAESKFRQFGKDGKPLQGIAVAEDTGVFQVNKTYHLARSKKLGYDIDTLAGNMAYARRLYEEQGAQPWVSSYPMWGKSPLAANFKPRTRTPIISAPQPEAVVVMNTVQVTSDANQNAQVVGTPISGQVQVAGEAISPEIEKVAEVQVVAQPIQEVR